MDSGVAGGGVSEPRPSATTSALLIPDILSLIVAFLEPPGLTNSAVAVTVSTGTSRRPCLAAVPYGGGPSNGSRALAEEADLFWRGQLPPPLNPQGQQGQGVSLASLLGLAGHQPSSRPSRTGGAGAAASTANTSNDPRSQVDRSELVNLALVCRTFRDVVTPIMYRALHLDLLSTSRLDKLVRSLTANPSLASHTRFLRMPGSVRAISSADLAVLRAVAPNIWTLDLARSKLRGWLVHRGPAVLEAFPDRGMNQLRVLNMTNVEWDHYEKGGIKIAKMIEEKFPQLEYLGLEGSGAFHPKTLLRLFTSLEKLTDLEFGSMHVLFSAKWVKLGGCLLVWSASR